MAKRIKSKKIKIISEYSGLSSVIFVLLFGIITFLIGRYFGKRENYSKIYNPYDNFHDDVKNKLALLDKI